MTDTRFGLRARSALALALACLVALVPAGILGWRLLEDVRGHFGRAFAENYARLSRERISAPISRELALSLRLAGSQAALRWLSDESDPERRAAFFREAEGYRRDFHDASYFLASAASGGYYFNSADEPFSDQPRYRIDRADPEDAWFFAILADPQPYNINVNPDTKLGTTRVWLNVPVTVEGRRLGLAGTGLDLGGFLERFIRRHPVGVTPMILDRVGAIQAHPDVGLISFGSTSVGGPGIRTLAQRLSSDHERERLARAMAVAAVDTEGVPLVSATLDGRSQLLALAYIPELQWYLVAALDLSVAPVIQSAWLGAGLLALGLVLLVLLLGFALAVERLLLRPLRDLRESAMAIAAGHYEVQLPACRQDEIGDLTRAFACMAEEVKCQTERLESRVRERTAQLEQANLDMAAAQRRIQDSLDYAGLIQRAILPGQRLAERLALRHFVLWRPRDLVGGDFYLFRDDGDRFLLGVVDCAGHGVPGALMTMLAYAALGRAIDRLGLESPAALLVQTDATLREMLRGTETRAIATHLDAGLVCVDERQGALRYAGARIRLYHSDGSRVESVEGGRRALGDRRVGQYADTLLTLDGASTYYLVTDGYLDQSGGDLGFGLGRSRFEQLILAHASRPLAEQFAALDRALDDYRGAHEQLDDVTLLAFRVG